MMKKISIFLICMIVSFSMVCVSYAESTSELNSQKSEVQSQIDDTKKELTSVQNEKESSQNELQNLSNQIVQAQAEIAQIESNLSQLEGQLDELNTQLEEAKNKFNEQQKMLESRLVSQYKNGKVTYLDVLLKSDGIQSFLSKYKYITMIAESDTELLHQMEEEKNKIEASQKEIEEKEKEVKISKANKEKAAVLLKNAQTQKEKEVSKLSDDEKKLQAEIDAKNEELAKINSEIKKNEQSKIVQQANYEKYVGGAMAWPTRNGKYVTSVYAPNGRSDSSWAGTAHKGVDINAPEGTPIYAAADGVVVYVNYSGYGGGWGLYVVISHGNGLYTRYAHGSSIASGISVGTTVTTNTVIMYSGHTGMANGAHLHFEVCQGSIYNQVNPCPYLGIANKTGSI